MADCGSFWDGHFWVDLGEERSESEVGFLCYCVKGFVVGMDCHAKGV